MILISHICWLLILHLPEYSQSSNHAESYFRFGPDYEYKYGTVPKRKEKHIYRLRAYDTNQRKWKLKNIDKPKFVFTGQNLVENRRLTHSAFGYIYGKYPPPRTLPYIYTLPRFTFTRRRKRTTTRTKPTSKPTRTRNHEEKRITIPPYYYDVAVEGEPETEEEYGDYTQQPRHTTTKPHRPRHTTTKPHRPRHTTTKPHRHRHTTTKPHRHRHTTTKPHRHRHTTNKPHRHRHTTTKPHRPRLTTTEPRSEVTTTTSRRPANKKPASIKRIEPTTTNNLHDYLTTTDDGSIYPFIDDSNYLSPPPPSPTPPRPPPTTTSRRPTTTDDGYRYKDQFETPLL